MQTSLTTIIALDVGGQRIGVAIANSIARIASPFVTLTNTDQVLSEIQRLVKTENVQTVVVGLPRGLNGQETEQTATTRSFVSSLEEALAFPIVFQDEALTSQKAEKELTERGKPFSKGDIDALAATYILEDYLAENPGAFA